MCVHCQNCVVVGLVNWGGCRRSELWMACQAAQGSADICAAHYAFCGATIMMRCSFVICRYIFHPTCNSNFSSVPPIPSQFESSPSSLATLTASSAFPLQTQVFGTSRVCVSLWTRWRFVCVVCEVVLRSVLFLCRVRCCLVVASFVELCV